VDAKPRQHPILELYRSFLSVTEHNGTDGQLLLCLKGVNAECCEGSYFSTLTVFARL